MADLDSQAMAAMLESISGKKQAQTPVEALSDAELISEFTELYKRRTTEENLTPNDKKSLSVRLRALQSEQGRRESAAEAAKTPRKRS
jgi:hypothetical protein